jgi:hypothetical protein
LRIVSSPLTRSRNSPGGSFNRTGKAGRLFGRAAAIASGAALLAILAAAADPGLRHEAGRLALFGARLIEIQAPRPGEQVAPGGVHVAVRFPAADRTAVGTFRVLLNGRTVTGELTRARTGAVGSVVGAVEGENRLRIEVFGRAWWTRRYFEDSAEVVFRVAPNFNLDRARMLDTPGPGPSLRPVAQTGKYRISLRNTGELHEWRG